MQLLNLLSITAGASWAVSIMKYSNIVPYFLKASMGGGVFVVVFTITSLIGHWVIRTFELNSAKLSLGKLLIAWGLFLTLFLMGFVAPWAVDSLSSIPDSGVGP